MSVSGHGHTCDAGSTTGATGAVGVSSVAAHAATPKWTSSSRKTTWTCCAACRFRTTATTAPSRCTAAGSRTSALMSEAVPQVPDRGPRPRGEPARGRRCVSRASDGTRRTSGSASAGLPRSREATRRGDLPGPWRCWGRWFLPAPAWRRTARCVDFGSRDASQSRCGRGPSSDCGR